MSSDFNSIEDFLEDNLFREWVFRPTPSLTTSWNIFFGKHPDKRAIALEAERRLQGLKQEMEASFPEEDLVDRMYAGIEEQIDSHQQLGARKRNLAYWLAAGCVTGVLGWGLWINSAQQTPVTYDNLVSSARTELEEYPNHSAQTLVLQLPDSSRIHLPPGAKISYARNFECQPLREIYLEGDAFFEIERDTARPFYVYSEELITRVLGTSFHIRNNTEKDQMTVSVLKGKVSVMKRQGITDDGEEELFLMPNQQALFTRKNTALTKSLVEHPVVISKPRNEDDFEFDDAPVTKIFAAIEKSYGIEISFDEAKMGRCLITASLSDESLFDILDLVCSALDARYFVEGTKIVVTGSGCQN